GGRVRSAGSGKAAASFAATSPEPEYRFQQMFHFANGRPRRPRATIETTPRVAQPPSTGVACEEVRVVIDGKEQTLEIVRQPRIHGQEAFWLCPGRCASVRMHLYLLNGEIGCRECLNLSYAVRHTRNRAALRARKLRRKLGGLPGLLSPIPPRPRHWRRDYYAPVIAELVAGEGTLAARLAAMGGGGGEWAGPPKHGAHNTARGLVGGGGV